MRRYYNRRYVYGSGAYRVGRRPRSTVVVVNKSQPRRRRARTRRVKGHGGYRIPGFNALKFGRGLGSMGGMAIGNAIAPGIGGELGGVAGGALGEALGRGFRALTGWGDYAVRSNTLVHPDQPIPSFGPDTIRVRKREFITDIPGSVAFSNSVFAVNPGLNETFPWLSAIANNYEQYRFNGLIFDFVSTSAVAISSTSQLSLGTICMASDYNALDPEYQNLPQMLGTMFSNSGRPSDNLCHAVECAPNDTAQKLYYVRSGDAPSGSDLRLYDMLSFQFGVSGLPSGTDDQLIGQLWASYDVTFFKSIQNNQIGFDIQTDWFSLTAPTTSAYFGTSNSVLAGSNLGCTTGGTNNAELRFPPTIESGYFLVTIMWRGASTACTVPTRTAGTVGGVTTCTTAGFYAGDTANETSNTGTTTGVLIYQGVWKILHRDAYFTLSAGTLPGTPTTSDLIVTQVNGEMFVLDGE